MNSWSELLFQQTPVEFAAGMNYGSDDASWLVAADEYQESGKMWSDRYCRMVGHRVPKFCLTLYQIAGKVVAKVRKKLTFSEAVDDGLTGSIGRRAEPRLYWSGSAEGVLRVESSTAFLGRLVCTHNRFDLSTDSWLDSGPLECPFDVSVFGNHVDKLIAEYAEHS